MTGGDVLPGFELPLRELLAEMEGKQGNSELDAKDITNTSCVLVSAPQRRYLTEEE